MRRSNAQATSVLKSPMPTASNEIGMTRAVTVKSPRSLEAFLCCLLTLSFSFWPLAGWNSARVPVRGRNAPTQFDVLALVYGGSPGLPASGAPIPRACPEYPDVSRSRLFAPADLLVLPRCDV